jgi:putative PIN family toxin of toxin-antitoxin system
VPDPDAGGAKDPKPDVIARLQRIVVDTNVVVSGALRRHGSPPARILDAIANGAVQLLWDERLEAEYEEVLLRPHFRLTPDTVRDLLTRLRDGAEHIAALPLAIALPDPDDLMFLEVAAAGSADYLVTANSRHFVPTRGPHAVVVVPPRAFVELL